MILWSWSWSWLWFRVQVQAAQARWRFARYAACVRAAMAAEDLSAIGHISITERSTRTVTRLIDPFETRPITTELLTAL